MFNSHSYFGCYRGKMEGEKPSECESECVLTEEEHQAVCDLAKDGRLEDLSHLVDEIFTARNCRVGPKTFCPDPTHQKPAPFVLSAQYGRKEVVEYFLRNFGNVIDINHSATIISITTKKKVHCATALWAASTGGHLDIVKLLVEHGAEVNKSTLTHSTPLRGASFHGHLEVMEFLLGSGAEINTPNCIGQSPLCIAAMRGQMRAVKYLVISGADVHQTTINGYSVMHLSATKGRVDIVKYLLSIGLSPMFQEANPTKEGYIPCPLFLAASTGQRKMVEELSSHPDCPPSCQADALLLLGSTRCEISTRGLTMASRELWARGLTVREENNLETEFLPPIDSYGNRQEVKNLEDLHKLSAEPNFSRHEAYFQNLIIRERCMGYGDQGLIYFLIRRGMWFCNHGNYHECELLWFRAMDMEVQVCEQEIKHARYGHSEGLQRDLEKDLSQYACGIWHMVHDQYKPNFSRYITFAFKELEILEYLKGKSDNALFIDVKVILGIILYIFASWLYYDMEVSAEEMTAENVWSQACEEFGCRFVNRYLFAVENSTLLHYALMNFSILEDEEQIYDKYPNLQPLIDALLLWGADEVINAPDRSGKRPIHVAVEQANQYDDLDVQELVSPLISGGAHMDAVSIEGQTAMYQCTNDVVKVVMYSSGPLSLLCQAANRIVSESIPYKNIGLPAHIVALIRLHDRKAFER